MDWPQAKETRRDLHRHAGTDDGPGFRPEKSRWETFSSTIVSRATSCPARALDALIQTALSDQTVTHVFIPHRDRLARPDDPIDALKLEGILSQAGLTLVFRNLVVPPRVRGRCRDLGEMIVALLDYEQAGNSPRELAEKMIFPLALAKGGFSTGGRPPFGFRRWLVQEDGTRVPPNWPKASMSSGLGIMSCGFRGRKTNWPSSGVSCRCWKPCRPRGAAAQLDGGRRADPRCWSSADGSRRTAC